MEIFPPRVLTLMNPPATTPVTLAEAKLFLRVDGDEENALISDLIDASCKAAESFMRRSLVTQSWKLEQHYVPSQPVQLPMGPVQSVTTVLAIKGEETTVVTTEGYSTGVGRRQLCFNQSLDADRVSIEYVAGYGDAEDVPAAIKQGILHQIAHFYQNREMAEEECLTSIRLWKSYREVQL